MHADAPKNKWCTRAKNWDVLPIIHGVSIVFGFFAEQLFA